MTNKRGTKNIWYSGNVPLQDTCSTSYMICQENWHIHRLSIECKVQIFIERDIYVPNHARCCNNHLDEEGLLLRPLLLRLTYVNRPYVIKGHELAIVLRTPRTAAQKEPSFQDENALGDEEFRLFTTLWDLTCKDTKQMLLFFNHLLPPERFMYSFGKKENQIFICAFDNGC